jgi:hypothetical protein
MNTEHKHPFVADGPQCLRRSKEYRRRELEIQAAVTSKYQAQLRNAPLWEHLILWFKMWRETERELQRMVSDEALYLKARDA